MKNIKIKAYQPSEAEILMDHLSDLNLETHIIYSYALDISGKISPYSLAFEIKDEVPKKAVKLMNKCLELFKHDKQFSNDLLEYCISIGAYSAVE